MKSPNPNDFNYNPTKEAAPSITSADELILKMNTLLSSVAQHLPALDISDVDKGRVISVMDALARDRDTFSSDLVQFKNEIIQPDSMDKELGVPISLYGVMAQFNSKLELQASNFAGHMTSMTSIESISKIIG